MSGRFFQKRSPECNVLLCHDDEVLLSIQPGDLTPLPCYIYAQPDGSLSLEPTSVAFHVLLDLPELGEEAKPLFCAWWQQAVQTRLNRRLTVVVLPFRLCGQIQRFWRGWLARMVQFPVTFVARELAALWRVRDQLASMGSGEVFVRREHPKRPWLRVVIAAGTWTIRAAETNPSGPAFEAEGSLSEDVRQLRNPSRESSFRCELRPDVGLSFRQSLALFWTIPRQVESGRNLLQYEGGGFPELYVVASLSPLPDDLCLLAALKGGKGQRAHAVVWEFDALGGRVGLFAGKRLCELSHFRFPALVA